MRNKSILLLLLFFSSCIKIVDHLILDEEKVFVLNSLITNDSVFSCYLNKTKSFFNGSGKPYENVNNAIVEMYEDGILIDTLHYINTNYYKGAKKPSFNKNYEIKIYLPNNKIMNAKTKMPLYKVDIDSAIYIDYFGYDAQEQTKYGGFKIYLNDLLLEKSNLLFGGYIEYTSVNFPVDSIYKPIRFGKLVQMDANILNEGYGKNDYYPSWITLKNDLFTNIKSNVIFGTLYGNIANYSPNDSIKKTFLVKAISNEYYLFYKTWLQQNNASNQNNANQNSIDSKLFPIEIQKVYSNVNGGVGVFGAFVTSTKELIHQEYE